MASELWKHFVPDATKRMIADALGSSVDEAGVLAAWLAGVHDVGKASPEFAWKASATFPEVLDSMRDAGLFVSDTGTSFGHWTVGELALEDWLKARGADPETARSFGSIVGGHHGIHPDRATVNAARDTPYAIGTGPWAEVRIEILDGMASLTGADQHLQRWITKPLPLPVQAALAGFIVIADWQASDSELFRYQDDSPSTVRARNAAAYLDLPRPWTAPRTDADPTTLLRARFPALGDAASRPIQDAIVTAARTCDSPPLLIVEAPMGVGKTEAALLAAEILASRFGQGGVFVGLPTMATANPMFDRTLDWLQTVLDRDDASISLAHSKAGLNDRFAEVARSSPWHGHVYDREGDERGRAVVNRWLRGRRRAGLASFVIGTIDQGLFGALKAKHLALRHFGLSSKVVVIDEVHSADVYMRQYLKALLSWLGAYRTPVILMSATLPPDQRDEYVAAFALGRGVRKAPTTDRLDTYPRLTAYDGDVSTIEVSETPDATSLTIKRIADDVAATEQLLADLLTDGGCAGVICNTVKRAQELYRVLSDRFPGDVELHHSRFLAPERGARAASLVRKLGRDATDRPQRLIVIGTQVLEQSLDVDFDVMVSDLAPIDLVLQRAGRLHRHVRTRPSQLAAPTLYLRGVDDWDAAPPLSVRGSQTVYGKASLLRAAAVLAGRTAVTLPADIPTLVRRGYAEDLQAPAGWESIWADAEAAAKKTTAEKISRAGSYLLDSPLKWTNLTGWIDVQGSDPDAADEQGRSAVRDSEDGLEVIVVYRDGDNLRLPDSAPRHSGAVVPTNAMWGTSGEEASLARAMAACTLALPIDLTNDGTIGAVIAALEKSVHYEVWQTSPWLKGHLVLPLDSTGRAVLKLGPQGPHKNVSAHLHYGNQEGLTVTKEYS